MKCIVPLARGGGYDKGVNRTTLFAAIAGKPLLGRLIDQLLLLKPEEVIFILGAQDRHRIIDYVKATYTFPVRFIQQKHSKGSAHAILGAREHVEGEAVILFGDTFFQADLKKGLPAKADAAIWTCKVQDPRQLGVVFSSGGVATKLIEKPDEPVSTEAMIGLYHVRDARKLFSAIEYLIEHNITTKGFFTLADALQVMIDRKARIVLKGVVDWIDADHDDGLFRLAAKLLAKQRKSLSKAQSSTIIQPVYIGKDVLVRGSVVGPNVSVADGASVVDSIVRDSLIGPGATVTQEHLSFSVIGEGVAVAGRPKQLVVDDRSRADG